MASTKTEILWSVKTIILNKICWKYHRKKYLIHDFLFILVSLTEMLYVKPGKCTNMALDTTPKP